MGKTWFIDIDGTILRHLNYSSEQDFYVNFQEYAPKMTPLPEVKEFFDSLPEEDVVILTTARDLALKEITEKQLKQIKNIKYKEIIFNCGTMERIVVNDIKPPKDGDENGFDKPMIAAIACNVERNEGLKKAISLGLELDIDK